MDFHISETQVWIFFPFLLVLGFLTSLKGQPWGESGVGTREESLPHYPEGREMMTPCAVFVLIKDVTGSTTKGASNPAQMREKDNWEVS